MAKVKIDAKDWTARIYIDGEEVRGVSEYRIHQTAKVPDPKLVLGIHVDEMEYDGEEVEITKNTLPTEHPADKTDNFAETFKEILDYQRQGRTDNCNIYLVSAISALVGLLFGGVLSLLLF